VNPKTQWQKGRSAMELALAWTMIPGVCSAPADFVALLQAHDVFREIEIVSGSAEDLVPFDKLGEARHADLNLICAGKQGSVVISVEAKADETYGSTVGKAMEVAQQRIALGKPTNAHTRIEALVGRFTPGLLDQSLRYQLFTACAATLALAEKHHAVAALLVIHEFVNGTRDDGKGATTMKKIHANAAALNAFVRALSRGSVVEVSAPSIAGPFPIAATTPFYIGKLQTDLSKGSS
jgi:hypothetical protein